MAPRLDAGTRPGCSPAWVPGLCSWPSEGDRVLGPSLVLPWDTRALGGPPASAPSCGIASPREHGLRARPPPHSPILPAPPGRACGSQEGLDEGLPRVGARSTQTWGRGWGLVCVPAGQGTGATTDVNQTSPRERPAASLPRSRRAPLTKAASRQAPRYLLLLCHQTKTTRFWVIRLHAGPLDRPVPGPTLLVTSGAQFQGVRETRLLSRK